MESLLNKVVVTQATLLKRDFKIGAFLLRNFLKSLFFEEHLRTAASEVTLRSDYLKLNLVPTAISTFFLLQKDALGLRLFGTLFLGRCFQNHLVCVA